MKKLTGEEIKKIELSILLRFDYFCKEHNLNYFLSGGTLLGAIRHQGFIPWDDDIDVCMPRPDYEKFIKIFDAKNENLLVKSYSNGTFSAPFTKIIDLNTKVRSIYISNEEQTGLWIDIFPVDGLPSGDAETFDIYKRVSFYRKILILCDARLGEGTTWVRKISKFFLKPIALMIGKKRCASIIEKIARKYPYETLSHVGAITWGLYGPGEKMKKAEFEKSVSVEFEGYNFPAFSCWDSYLKGLYGDYMKLPPVEKRKTHDMEVYCIHE